MLTIEARDKFVAYCEQRTLSPETLKWYKQFIKKLNEKYSELPTTPEPIEEIISSYPGEYRRLGCFRALRAFYNWISGRFDIPNPFKKGNFTLIHSPKVQKLEKPTLNLEQMKTLLEYDHPKVTKALLWFLTDTGCRIGEASNLKREDIKEDKVTIRGKTGQRTIPISPKVRELLLDIKPEDFRAGRYKDEKTDCVFQVCTKQLMECVCNAFKNIGLPEFHAHSLRHTFCTLFKGDLMSLRLITGHTNWAMLEHYKHNRLDTAQEQHAQGSPLAQLHKNGVEDKPAPAKEPIESKKEDESKPIIVKSEAKTALNSEAGNNERILISLPASFSGKSITISLN